MCGIFGYIGKQDAVEACCLGLELLEYRGYDSTGIAGITQGKIAYCKREGKLSALREILNLSNLELAIAHTRWATHGAVNDQNAHPHLDTSQSLALIHNGIIENHADLKEKLQGEGVSFSSDTDSEVIVQLIAKYYRGNLLEAVHEIVPLLEGSFSFLVIHKDHQEIVGLAHGCPLTVGINEEEQALILSSDPNAFIGKQFHVFFLEKGDIVRAKKGTVDIYGKGLIYKERQGKKMQGTLEPPSKQGFSHFMLKEIMEQPKACTRALAEKWRHDAIQDVIQGAIHFQELHMSKESLQEIDTIWMVGSGTSALAGLVGSLLFEDFAKLPTFCEIASEAQYRTVPFSPKTLLLAISQSGETADTLSVLRKAKQEKMPVITLCNVEHSSMAREADGTLFLKAGPEVSVCSTKAFTSQLLILSLFALYIGTLKKRISPSQCHSWYQALTHTISTMQHILNQQEEIARIATRYAHFDNFFFMGRRYMYPTCMEAALKLKEISYVNASGYAAGDLKHGPIALLDAQFPVVAFCANSASKEKMISNLMEVKARKAPLLAIAPTNMPEVQKIADDLIWVPATSDPLAPFPSIVVGQLLAYFIAKERGCPIDQPRNLAKSVTVE